MATAIVESVERVTFEDGVVLSLTIEEARALLNVIDAEGFEVSEVRYNNRPVYRVIDALTDVLAEASL